MEEQDRKIWDAYFGGPQQSTAQPASERNAGQAEGSPASPSIGLRQATLRIVPVLKAKPVEYRPLPFTSSHGRQPNKPVISPYPHLALVNLNLASERSLVERALISGKGDRWRGELLMGPNHDGGMKTLQVDGRSRDEVRDKMESAIQGYQNDLVVEFASRFGLLGLGRMQVWDKWKPWQDTADPMVNGHNKYFYRNRSAAKGDRFSPAHYCEPLDAFRDAAREFQKTAGLLVDIPEGQRDSRNLEFGIKVLGRSGVTWLPYFENGQHRNGYNIPTLLAWCYFVWWFELTQGAQYRRCKNPRCNRVFVAKRKSDAYCSGTCRRAEVARNRPDRRLYGEISALRSQGAISPEQAKKAREMVAEQWVWGEHDERLLRKALLEAGLPLSRFDGNVDCAD
jgi:hypothetical protein